MLSGVVSISHPVCDQMSWILEAIHLGVLMHTWLLNLALRSETVSLRWLSTIKTIWVVTHKISRLLYFTRSHDIYVMGYWSVHLVPGVLLLKYKCHFLSICKAHIMNEWHSDIHLEPPHEGEDKMATIFKFISSTCVNESLGDTVIWQCKGKPISMPSFDKKH